MAPATATKKASSTVVTGYLVVYNLCSAAAWALILAQMATHLYTGLGGNLVQLTTAEGVAKLLRLSSETFLSIGILVKYVQSAALLEVLHVLFGLVLRLFFLAQQLDNLLTPYLNNSRSGFLTTAMQVASRITMVWYICEQFPSVPLSPFYTSMVFAWSFTEVVRYNHYATGLLNIKISALEWLRYSTFYLLYPIGAGSEAALIFLSAKYAAEYVGPVGEYATYVLLAAWPPALAMMMTYMHAQRSKHLRHAPKAAVIAPTKAVASKRATTPPPSIKSAPAVAKTPTRNTASTTALDTPARSTRSKSKAL